MTNQALVDAVSSAIADNIQPKPDADSIRYVAVEATRVANDFYKAVGKTIIGAGVSVDGSKINMEWVWSLPEYPNGALVIGALCLGYVEEYEGRYLAVIGGVGPRTCKWPGHEGIASAAKEVCDTVISRITGRNQVEKG